jgi:hypothetical protein
MGRIVGLDDLSGGDGGTLGSGTPDREDEGDADGEADWAGHSVRVPQKSVA